MAIPKFLEMKIPLPLIGSPKHMHIYSGLKARRRGPPDDLPDKKQEAKLSLG